MSGINYHLIVCILVEHNRQLCRNGKIHPDSYMWTLDKPTASLSAVICGVDWVVIVLNFYVCMHRLWVLCK